MRLTGYVRHETRDVGRREDPTPGEGLREYGRALVLV